MQALSSVPDLPPCPDDISPAQYTNLMFADYCHVRLTRWPFTLQFIHRLSAGMLINRRRQPGHSPVDVHGGENPALPALFEEEVRICTLLCLNNVDD